MQLLTVQTDLEGHVVVYLIDFPVARAENVYPDFTTLQTSLQVTHFDDTASYFPSTGTLD